jgi:hypothetical protein
LYILFFFFLATPTMQSLRTAKTILSIAILLKLTAVATGIPSSTCDLRELATSFIWFALGMACFFWDWKKYLSWKIVILTALFLPISLLAFYAKALAIWTVPLLTLLGIAMSVSFFVMASKAPWKASHWTMQIFLLHTICAPACRALLLKMGVASFEVHLVAGLFASFALPIAIGWIAERSVYLNFFFAPLATVRKARKRLGLN